MDTCIKLRDWLRRWWWGMAMVIPACGSVPVAIVGDAAYQVGYAVCADSTMTSADMDSTFSALLNEATVNYIAGCEDGKPE